MDRLVVFDVGLFVLDHPAENPEKFVRNVGDYELLRLPLLPLATEVFRESIVVFFHRAGGQMQKFSHHRGPVAPRGRFSPALAALVFTRADASGQQFEGTEGAARCRALMGSMQDLHRSMRSMMARHHGDQSATESSDRHSRRGRGMIGERMGSGSGSMGARSRRMGEEMSMEEMRHLCRTLQATMRDVMHGESPREADGSAEEQVSSELDFEAQTEEWLGATRGLEKVEDRTGQSDVTVEVGAGSGLTYAPAAIRVEPGTTVRWRWTGNGGLHDVAFVDADVNTPPRGEQGETFAHTFAESGEYRYECTPHTSVGMRGVVIVE